MWIPTQNDYNLYSQNIGIEMICKIYRFGQDYQINSNDVFIITMNVLN